MALEFDLSCQTVLNRHDLEIEKMRLSVWGVTEDVKVNQSAKPKPAPKTFKPQKQTLTAKDIMRNHKANGRRA